MNADPHIASRQLRDGTKLFDISVIEAKDPTCTVLFSVGRGGNPLRHLALLRSMARLNCTVIAPHSEMLASPTPSGTDLNQRIRRLDASTDEYAKTHLPLVGIGHSIGCVNCSRLPEAKLKRLLAIE